MNPLEEGTENSQAPRASKLMTLLMAVIMICLVLLAIFANVQRSRRDTVEVVVVKSTASPMPRER